MSSSEGENFDLDNVSGSESEDYAPVKAVRTIRLLSLTHCKPSERMLTLRVDKSSGQETSIQGQGCT